MNPLFFSCRQIIDDSNRMTIINLNNVVKVKQGSFADIVVITLNNGGVVEVRGTVQRFNDMAYALTKTNILPL